MLFHLCQQPVLINVSIAFDKYNRITGALNIVSLCMNLLIGLCISLPLVILLVNCIVLLADILIQSYQLYWHRCIQTRPWIFFSPTLSQQTLSAYNSTLSDLVNKHAAIITKLETHTEIRGLICSIKSILKGDLLLGKHRQHFVRYFKVQ